MVTRPFRQVGTNAPDVLDATPTSTAIGLVVRTVNASTAVQVNNSTLQEVPVKDDMDSFEAFHQTLSAGVDTTIAFSQEVRMIRVSNWDVNDRVLVKDGAISSDTTSGAARIGFAPAASVPATAWFPFRSTSIHLRCANAAEVTVEGYF